MKLLSTMLLLGAQAALVYGQTPTNCPFGWSVSDIGGQGHFCYKLVQAQQPWQTAESDCVAQGGHLASVWNEQERDLIYTLCSASPSNQCWTGGNDRSTEGTWRWSDGSSRSYINSFWSSGQPDNMGNQDCQVMWDAEDPEASADDLGCGSARDYICKMPAGCPPGSYKSGSSCVGCPAGRYSPSILNTGVGGCLGCDPGRYGSTTGLTTPLCTGKCANGHYCPSGSSTSANAFNCPAGRYGLTPGGASHGLGSAACSGNCAAGWYCGVEETSSTPAGQQCQPGFYGVGGESTPTCAGMCQAGYYCTAGSPRADQNACGAEDKFCPEGSSAPQDVDVGHYSTPTSSPVTTRSGQAVCEAGYYCANGRRTGCPAGRYSGAIAATSSATCSDCDRGFFCPLASTQPTETPCGAAQPAGQEAAVYCPAGTSSRLAVPPGHQSLPADAPVDQRWDTRPCPQGHNCIFGIAYPLIQFTSGCTTPAPAQGPFPGSTFTGTLFVDENQPFLFNLDYVDQDPGVAPVFQGARPLSGFQYGAACPGQATFGTAFTSTPVTTNPLNGQLRIELPSAGFNYEGCEVAGVDFVYEQGGFEYTCRMMITVENVNDAPQFLPDSAVRSIEENSKVGVPVGPRVLALNEDDGQELAFSIIPSSDPYGYFSISVCSGQIFAAVSDISYEQALCSPLPFVDLQVEVVDNGIPPRSAIRTVRVNIININEPPVFLTTTGTAENDNLGYGFQVSEDVTVPHMVGVAAAMDPDCLPLTWSLEQRNGQANFKSNPEFTIAPGTGSISAVRALDYESVEEYAFTLRVQDQFPLGVPGFEVPLSNELVIEVLDANDAPAVTAVNLNVPEDAQIGDPVNGYILITDPETNPGRAAVTSVITSGPNSNMFTAVPLAPGAGGSPANVTAYGLEVLVAGFDFETASSYTFQVTVTDVGVGHPDASTTITVTVQITDVNEPPIFPVGGPMPFEVFVPENTIAGTRLLAQALQYTEPDVGQTADFLVRNYTSTFDVDAVSGVLRLTQNVLNYEAQNQYGLVLSAQDKGVPALSTDATLAVHVTNVNEPPSVVPGQVFTVPENHPAGGVIGSVIVADQDSLIPAEGEVHTWTHLAGEGLHNPRAYFVSGGTQFLGIDLFKVNSSTGEVRVNDGVNTDVWTSLLDFEDIQEYTVEVFVHDAGIAGGPVFNASGTFKVQLTNVQEAPLLVPRPDGSAQVRAVAESAPSGTNVGPPLQILDQENQTYSCAFVTPTTEWSFAPGPGCQVQAAQPVQTLSGAQPEPLTREYTISINDTGSPPRTTTTILNITIADNNQYPVFSDHTVSVREDAPLDSIAGDVGMASYVTDVNTDQTHQFFILSFDPVNTNTWFYIAADNINAGNISVGAPLNYEAHPSVTLGVQTQDNGKGGGLTDTATWTVNLLNVNEPPSWIAQAPISFPETVSGGSTVGQTIGSVSWQDEDSTSGDSWTVSIAPSTADPAPVYLAVDNSGSITIAQPVDHEAHGTLSYNFTVCDSGNALPPPGVAPGTPLCASAVFDFIVQDVNEPPTVVANTLLVEEASAPGATLKMEVNGSNPLPALITWSDPDDPSTPFGQVTFSIIAGDAVHFVVSNTGYVQLAQVVDFENLQQHTFTVQVEDNPGGSPRFSDSAVYTVQVVDDNDLTGAVYNGGGQLVHPTTGTSDHVVFFNGTNMGPTQSWLASASGANPSLSSLIEYKAFVSFSTSPSQPYPPTGSPTNTKEVTCVSITANTAIACAVPSGVGRLTWQLQTRVPLVDASWSVIPGQFSTQVYTAQGTTDYAAPSVTGVVLASGQLSTTGGQSVVITGTNLGPADTQYENGDVRYGVAEPYFVAESCTVTTAHTQLTCQTQVGVGSDMFILLRTGGKGASPSPFTPSNPAMSYGRPAISSVTVWRAGMQQPKLATAGGDTIRIIGSNFGPARLLLANNNGVTQDMPVVVEVEYGLPRGEDLTYPGSSPMRFQALACTHNVAPHTQINCLAPPGTGGNLVVRVAVKVTYPGGAQEFQYSQLTNTTVVSYQGPLLDQVTGPGSRQGGTLGNELIRVIGRNFGAVTPVMGSNGGFSCTTAADPNQVTAADIPIVRYGRPGTGQRRFTARYCIVKSDSVIECCSAPGTGAQFEYTVELDGQVSPAHYEPESGYHPPVVTGYLNADATGPAELSPTPGDAVVVLQGANFGDGTQWIDSVEYGKDGQKDYDASNCAMVPGYLHTRIQCRTVQGAGAGLSWTVTVDGLESEAPSTSYGPPVITGFAGAAAVNASTLGGQVVELLGYNFGPQMGEVSNEVPAGPGSVNKTHTFLDWVRYGPVTGEEYRPDNCTVLSHTRISCVTKPGSGKDHTWTVRVEGRTGPGSAVKWSYAAPVLSGITTPPAGVPTTGGVLGALQGTNLGTQDPLASAYVQIRLAKDGGAVIRAEVQSMSVLPGGLEQVTFFFPEGYGFYAQARLVVDGAQLQYSNFISFNYAAPIWSGYKVRGDTLAAFVRVEALGENFAAGPINNAGFPIARLFNGPFEVPAENILSWDHTRLEFKLLRPSSGSSGAGAGESHVPVDIQVFKATEEVPIMQDVTTTVTDNVTTFVNGTATWQIVSYNVTTQVPTGNSSVEDVYHEASRSVEMEPPSFASRESISSEPLDTAGGTRIHFQVRGITNNTADLDVFVGPGTLLYGPADGYASTTPRYRDNRCTDLAITYCLEDAAALAVCCDGAPGCVAADREDTFYVECTAPAGQGTRNRLRAVFATGADIGLGSSNSSADQVYMEYKQPMIDDITFTTSSGALSGRALQSGTVVNGLVDKAGLRETGTVRDNGRNELAFIFNMPTDTAYLHIAGANLGMSAGMKVISPGGLPGATDDFMPRPSGPGASLNPSHTLAAVAVPPGINGLSLSDDRIMEFQVCDTYGCGQLADVSGQIGSLNFTAQQYNTDIGAGDPPATCRDVGCTGVGRRISFTYAAPVLFKGTVKLPTTGGAALALNGANFGPASLASAVSVTVAGQACPLRLTPGGDRMVNPGASPHNQIVCDMPPGVGASMDVSVTVGSQTVSVPSGTDPDFSIGYLPPRVFNMFPRTGPTNGALNLTLTGENFGTDPSKVVVRLRSNPADVAVGREEDVESPLVSFVNDTTIVFTLPEGQGGAKVVEVLAGGQSSLVSALQPAPASAWPPAAYSQFVFDYLPPRVASVSPNCDTFGCTITIRGENFGKRDCNAAGPVTRNSTADDPVQVAVRVRQGSDEARGPDDMEYNCVPQCAGHTHDEFQCVLDPGMGRELDVYVRIGSKEAPIDASAGTYSYAAPILTSTVSSYVSARGAVNLTFYGKSMGIPERSPARVFVGGKECLNATVATIDAANRAQSLKCLRPETDTIGAKEVRFELAFQPEQSVAAADGLLQFNCPDGHYGQPGELCEPCPIGGVCEPHRVSCVQFINDTRYGTEVCTQYMAPYAQPEHWRLTLPTPNRFCDQLNRGNRTYPNNGTCFFFAGCDPPNACAGRNLCTEGYEGERCGQCVLGFFRLDGECVKCPDLAGLYIALFVIGILVICAGGYWLNKQNINLAFISIGVDYLQVLALFARTKIAWPPVIKNLFRFMSVFNLNIDLAAPECLNPEMQYDVKWAAIMLLPVLIASVFFLVYLVNYLYKRCILKVAAEKRNSHMPQLVGVCLTMFYLLYLYLTRTTFDIFNCSPTNPDDGFQYMEVVFEKCWESDLHNRLFPGAIVTLIVYVIAYPVGVGYVLYSNKDTVKVDQLLRAQYLGDEAKTSTRTTYSFRKMAEKLYRNFKPGKWYWQVIIIARKFFIAVTSLLFRRTPAYQMAMIVMVLFFSYAAQVKQRPYMSMSEYRAEVLYHEKKVLEGDARHMKLDQDIKDAKKKARKADRSKGTNMDRIRANKTKVAAASFVTNYNTVEMILLMCAILVALAGVMFDSRRFADGKSPEGKIALTALVMIIIIASLIYFISVCVSEIMEAAFPDTFAKTCKCCRATKSTIELEVEAGMMKGRGEAMDMGTAVNPLMMRKKDGSKEIDEDMLSQLNAILQQGKVPNHQQWQAIRTHVLGMRTTVTDLNLQARALKKAQTLAQAKKSLSKNTASKPKKKGRKKFAATASRAQGDGEQTTKKQAWADAMKGGAAKGLDSDTSALLRQQMAARQG